MTHVVHSSTVRYKDVSTVPDGMRSCVLLGTAWGSASIQVRDALPILHEALATGADLSTLP